MTKNRYSGRKFSDRVFNDFFVANGMIHLGYKATCVSDIVNSFYIKGCEIVNSTFSGWYDNFLPYLPKDKDVVLEISGAEFSDEEKTVIENAIWNYYHDQLAITKKHIKANFIRETWIFISFVLSCILLFISRKTEMTVLQDQYAALPFWFFGYRVLTFLVLEIYPLIKDRKMLEQMASMKVFFSGVNPLNEVPADKIKEYSKEILKYREDQDSSDYRYIRDVLFMDGNRANFTFHVESLEDIVPACNIKDYELANPEFEEYLRQLTDYAPENAEVDIHFTGTKFSDDEKNTIRRSLRNSLSFGIGHVNSELRDNYKKVVVALICLILSSVWMNISIDFVDTITSETIYMVFWFFADYLAEFIILDPIDGFKEKKKLEQLKNAELIFDD